MATRAASPLASDVLLRDVAEADLPIFFEQQLDEDTVAADVSGAEVEECILKLEAIESD